MAQKRAIKIMIFIGLVPRFLACPPARGIVVAKYVPMMSKR
jgi:hypothetical protein